MLGWIMVALGFIGVFLPILPTVPFLLVAAFCFERGSPKMHLWLTNHPLLGPPIRDWNRDRVIRPRAKALAVGCIGVGIGASIHFRDFPIWIKVLMAAVAILASLFILLQRSRPAP